MSVYVDDMRLPAMVGRLRGNWSHMAADTVEELVDFATNKLGMRAAWLQDGNSPRFHFDLVDRRRLRAIELGAIPISTWELAQMCLSRRPVGQLVWAQPAVQGHYADPGPALSEQALIAAHGCACHRNEERHTLAEWDAIEARQRRSRRMRRSWTRKSAG